MRMVLSNFVIAGWLLMHLPEDLGHRLTIVRDNFDPILIDHMHDVKWRMYGSQNN